MLPKVKIKIVKLYIYMFWQWTVLLSVFMRNIISGKEAREIFPFLLTVFLLCPSRLHSFLPYYYSVDGKCKDGFTYVLYINGGHPPWGLLYPFLTKKHHLIFYRFSLSVVFLNRLALIMFITGAVLSTITSTRPIGTPSWRSGCRGTAEDQRPTQAMPGNHETKANCRISIGTSSDPPPKSWSIIPISFVWIGCSEDQVTECHTCSSLSSRAAIMNSTVNKTSDFI